MNRRQSLESQSRASSSRTAAAEPPDAEIYNIIPIHDGVSDHPSLLRVKVRAAIAALGEVGELPRPPFQEWGAVLDLLDWLRLCFGFQRDNVRNQREHLVLLLSNDQMRCQPNAAVEADALDPDVARRLRRKLLSNYTSWCSYLGRKSNVHTSGRLWRELLHTSLFLLIWGEAANLRLVPECLCYIFHHKARDLNRILAEEIDQETGRPFYPSPVENAFLVQVVTPIYKTIKKEEERSRGGTAPHSAWRNYDDINEYFWSRHCFDRLGWPINESSNFFFGGDRSVGKTGFVEQRTLWNVFRSFARLWVMLLLFFQAALITAWEGTTYPWEALSRRDVQVHVLTIFSSWAGLRLFQSVLDACTQYRLVLSCETACLGVRMVFKTLAAMAWTVGFSVLYSRIWSQRYADRGWSAEATGRLITFLKAALVFIIPELLALALFILPWVRKFLEKTNWKIFYALTWWFQTRTFVGRGLREGLLDNIKYSVFWVLVLASKFTFSYFLQIKPMVAPTKIILDAKTINYQWPTQWFALGIIWLPVILIYLMDLQIWYCIFSSITGALIGLFSHLGEIRNMGQLRLRFQLFAGAMLFNLRSEEQVLVAGGTLKKKFFDAILRLKVRCGLGKPYKKIESNQVEATKFALIWNEIIASFREEDIISDREVELLELPPNAWNIGVIRWPCFLICNELLHTLDHAKELHSSDRALWRKVSRNEYRRCAVIEAYDSAKYLLLEIVKRETKDHSIVSKLFAEMDDAIQREKFTQIYKMDLLPEVHLKLISLLELISKPKQDMNEMVNALQTLYYLATQDLPKEKRNNQQLMQAGLAPQRESADLLFENAIVLPDDENMVFYRNVRRLHTILTSKDSMHDVPVNLEARRRIVFFSNSLFMNMPHPPRVAKMMAFSVLTPYYNEDVLYTKEQLYKLNEDGISILFSLQKIYEDEWKNFLERMKRNGMVSEDGIWSEKLSDLRLWASNRGQTLSRTVRGMVYYHKALKMLACLDTVSETDIREGSRKLAAIRRWMRRDSGSNSKDCSVFPLSESQGGGDGGASVLFKGHVAALMKFTYVVTSQTYGIQKADKDPVAEWILYLMKNNEALRVAYVDEDSRGKDDEVEYYSVLVKYDQKLQEEVEIYRIRLPGPLKLGEGKPENQNHAIIFTRGDAVQTIDMNQDNYFEEALKMRNLLEEFKRKHGIRKPTILGVRENIYTGSVSSIAGFMSAQEKSFVTLGQRVLAKLLKVRMHYGHPDVFDRLWFLSRGGLSKASRVINISEDIFAGFNCTLRGGNVTHHEYIQVGKGRDLGLNQISMFEAKVASGNGEQLLSRDVYRLGHRLDFFRMLSFFYSTVGFFFNNMVLVYTVYAFVWGRLYLELSGVEESLVSAASNNAALGTILNQQFIIQLGLFTALPMIVENTLEAGFLYAVCDFLSKQFLLASVFYTFSLGTRSHYFGRTILHGGAKYRATGRGFVVEHRRFAENYRLYARSHFLKAIELGVILAVYASHSPMSKSTFAYRSIQISSWALVVSWIMAPFVFNPSEFDWSKTVFDFDDFMKWIWYQGGVFTKADQSWETWWYDEQHHLETTGLLGKLVEIILGLRFFILQYGVVYHLAIANRRTVYLLSWIYLVVALAIYIFLIHARNKYAAKEHIYYRAIKCFVICLTTLVIVILLRFTPLNLTDQLTSIMAFIPTGWAIISIAQVIRPFLKSTVMWETVVSVARLYEILFGVIVMAPVALLSWMPGFQSMQARILFNEALGRGLQLYRIRYPHS